MKQLLSALIFCTHVIIAADYIDFRNNFDQLNKQKYNNCVGYNLDLQLWQDNRPNVHHELPTLFVHGHNASPTTRNEWIHVAGPYKIPGDIVTFRFIDATDNNDATIFNSNFDQKEAILATLVALKSMLDCHASGWNIYAHSRGAATVVNTLAILNQKVSTWNNKLKKSDITEKDRLLILENLKKGVIILETPMTTIISGINSYIKRLAAPYYANNSWIDSIILATSYFVNALVLPIISRGGYLPWNEQALSCVDSLPTDLKVLVHFQENDKDVSNDNDLLFAEKLIKRLGADNVWIILGNDDNKEIDDTTWHAVKNAQSQHIIKLLGKRSVRAHNAGQFTLLQNGVINTFYKNHGGSFLDNEHLLIQGNAILDNYRKNSLNLPHYFKNYSPNIPNYNL